ncbi:MAG: hypothetical protein OQL18_07525, partial [Deltaproteobacteria bacterium]|nr:hypothetical protein [Deltaproteobacteria bacterium]
WMMSFVGIDFGARKAGTTAVCFLASERLLVVEATKGANADLFLQPQLENIKPQKVFIDAPLSLSGGYFAFGGDYMFRSCDRELGAMSPMFLGGLTARAIKLKSEFCRIEFIETCPRALARVLNIATYKQHPLVWQDL